MSHYLQVNLTKDEIVKLFRGLNFKILIQEKGDVHRCEYCEESSGGNLTKDFLTKDEFVLNGYKCDTCNNTTLFVMSVRYYDSYYDVDDDC